MDLKAYGPILVSNAITLFFAWMWFRKGRAVKKDDEEDSESKNERQNLAAKLEATRQERADKLEDQASATQQTLADLRADIATLKAQAAPINAAFAAVLVKELTHFHTPVMDALMEKLDLKARFPVPTLTDEDEVELIAALQQRSKDMGPEISDNERDAAKMFPIMIRRLKREAAALASGVDFTTIQVVGVLRDSDEVK